MNLGLPKQCQSPKSPLAQKKFILPSPIQFHTYKNPQNPPFPLFPSITIVFSWRETDIQLSQKRNGGTTTRRRAESGSIGGRVHCVEEELAVSLRFDHIPPYRMAVSHCPMGPTTAHPHLGFIFRRSKTRLRDPHFLGRP